MDAHKTDQGRLRISAPTWFGKAVPAADPSGFRKLYPKINFEISLADGFVNILDQDFDLAIRISSAPSGQVHDLAKGLRHPPRARGSARQSRFAAMDHPGDRTPDDAPRL